MGKLLLYREGQSLVSKAIRLFSPAYQHAAWQRDDGRVYEAVPSGTRLSASPGEQHNAPTVIDVYDIGISAPDEAVAQAAWDVTLGERYDFPALAGILLDHPEWQDPNGWFCSEWMMYGLRLAGVSPFARCGDWEIWPCHLRLPKDWKIVGQIQL